MDAAGSCSRKRKLADEAAAPETSAAGEGHGPAEDQKPLLPAAGEDRISHLPDDVLSVIISRLPTKKGACTQILASRWRHLWRSAPLNLDHRGLCRHEDLGAVVSRILAAHQGPCRRFCAPVYHLHGGGDGRVASADAWLRSPALRNLQQLDVRNCLPSTYALPLPSLTAAFRFSETLCVATIGDCQLPDITDQAILFPKLKTLALEHVRISESSLHTMIAGCPALECLLISGCYGFRCVRVNSISLRSICVRGYHFHNDEIRFGELIIENAPCLERLLQLIATGLRTSVISTPKLETIGSLGSRDTFTLMVDSTVIQTNGPGKPNFWRQRHRDFIRSFDIRLKKISVRHYRRIKSHVDFATFFVLNARVLELMTFQVFEYDYTEEYFAEQRKKLQLDSKASSGAQFQFTTDTPHRFIMDFGVYDLDLADPFERKDPYEFRALS